MQQPRAKAAAASASSYEAPTLTVVGSVHMLTQTNKKYGPTDGFTYQGNAITNASR